MLNGSAVETGVCLADGSGGGVCGGGGDPFPAGTTVAFTTTNLTLPARVAGTCNDTGAFTTSNLTGNSIVTASLEHLPTSGVFTQQLNWASGTTGDIIVCTLATSTASQSLTWNIMVVTPPSP
jgi:hypothetical protein